MVEPLEPIDVTERFMVAMNDRDADAADALIACGLLADDQLPPKLPPPILSQDPLTGALTSV